MPDRNAILECLKRKEEVAIAPHPKTRHVSRTWHFLTIHQSRRYKVHILFTRRDKLLEHGDHPDLTWAGKSSYKAFEPANSSHIILKTLAVGRGTQSRCVIPMYVLPTDHSGKLLTFIWIFNATICFLATAEAAPRPDTSHGPSSGKKVVTFADAFSGNFTVARTFLQWTSQGQDGNYVGQSGGDLVLANIVTGNSSVFVAASGIGSAAQDFYDY